MQEIRKPVVAGQFYEEDPSILKKQISFYLDNAKNLNLNELFAIIVPHAGYIFSGKCAAQAYKQIQNLKEKPENIILIGPNHNTLTEIPFSLSIKDFETPLVIVKNNTKLGKEIIEKTKAEINEHSHLPEHCLEVQLPFLQSILKKFSIVPILVSSYDYEQCVEFAKKLAKIIKSNPKTMIIISSDFTHYGPGYGFLPFPQDSKFKENLYKLDKGIINHIINLDSKSFFQEAKNTTICGSMAITIVIEIANILRKKVKLIDYYTSADIHPSNNAVGYASILFS